MPLLSYFTNILTTMHQAVFLSKKFTVDLAAGTVTSLEGKRIGVVSGVGTGVLTVTLPQIFKNIVSVQSYVVDTAVTGAQVVVTSDSTSVGTKSQFTMTVTKPVSGTPTPVTTGIGKVKHQRKGSKLTRGGIMFPR